MILVETQIVGVQAKVDIEAPIPVIVGYDSMCKRSRRGVDKPEGILF